MIQRNITQSRALFDPTALSAKMMLQTIWPASSVVQPKILIAGAWRDVEATSILIGGEWRTVVEISTVVDGLWRTQ